MSDDNPESQDSSTETAPEPSTEVASEDAARDALIAEVEALERGESPDTQDEPTADASGNPPPDAAADGDGAESASASAEQGAADNAGEATDPDPWANVPEAAKAEYARAEQARRTAEGRLAAAESRLAELTAAPREPERTETQTADPAAAEAAFTKFAEDYPDVAEGVKPLFDVLRGENAELRAKLDGATASLRTLGESHLHSAYAEQEQAVMAEHPEFAEIAAEQPNDRSRDFQAWYAEQPEFIRQAVEANAETVRDATTVNRILAMYKSDRGLTNGANGNGNAAEAARRTVQRNGARGNPRPSPGATVPESRSGALPSRDDLIREVEADEQRRVDNEARRLMSSGLM